MYCVYVCKLVHTQVFMCAHVLVCVHVFVCFYPCLCVYMFVYVCECVHVSVCVHMCMYMCVRVCVHVCMCVYLSVYMYVCVCICVHACMHWAYTLTCLCVNRGWLQVNVCMYILSMHTIPLKIMSLSLTFLLVFYHSSQSNSLQ